jgi:hypothetical protein
MTAHPMTAAPKRRWPRFSLRTLFVVVTVFGCWLGYELNWIRQRHAVIAEPKWSVIEREPGALAQQPTAPDLLWIWGERGYATATRAVRRGDSLNGAREEIQKVERLFPESRVFSLVVPLPPH